MRYTIIVYERSNKDKPFDAWLNKQDNTIRYMIIAKLERISLGNLGIAKPVGDGISEIKIDIGPGYRIYFKKVNTKIILLLCAGTKKTQQKDIEKAKEYYEEYNHRGRKDGKK